MVKTTPLQKLPSCVQRLVLVSLICLSSIVVSCIQVRRSIMYILVGNRGESFAQRSHNNLEFSKKFKLISHLTPSIMNPTDETLCRSVPSCWCAWCPWWLSTGTFSTSTGNTDQAGYVAFMSSFFADFCDFLPHVVSPDAPRGSCSGWRVWAAPRCSPTSPTPSPGSSPSAPSGSSRSSSPSSATRWPPAGGW